ncbi:MAG: response regulator transcription factor [Clostridiales bacterium]|nr:response regulator transcription factor [Clostridiales bacterium]
MAKVLIVDDEEHIREILKMNLELSGYKCIEAEDGEKAIEILEKITPDIVLLDIMLPKKDGYQIADEFIKKDVPIIFLTAKENVLDKVKGLKLGAEDYIVKPFDSMELLARIEVVLRRRGKENNIFKYKNVEIDFSKRQVKVDNNEVELTSQEFNLLEVLIKNKNLALSRDTLLEKAWGYDYYGDTRTVDIHIQRLRKKLNWDEVINTVYKYGYRLEIDKNEVIS